jgi:hypothetical protein
MTVMRRSQSNTSAAGAGRDGEGTQNRTGATAATSITEQEARELGVEAYLYFYPLVLMDAQRRQMINVEPGKKDGFGPMNMFNHYRTLPTAEFPTPGPGFDYLYSMAWLDLTREPMVVSAPDTNGRYYLLEMVDMWNDAFAAPGKRNTGTAAVQFAVVPQCWTGKLPVGLRRIDAPTPYVWVLGRTLINGPADYDAVHRIQDGYAITSLSQWGQPPRAVEFTPDPTVDMQTPARDQIHGMSAEAFFACAAELLKLHPTHVTDWNIVARMERIGIERGQSFDAARLDPAVRHGLEAVPEAALAKVRAKAPTMARVVNGWLLNTDTIGIYGNYYLKRAWSAWIGVGTNQPEDAFHPLNVADADGEPLNGDNNYVMHFAKDELPPVEGLWSVNVYDPDFYIVANPLNRYAIGDRDALTFNADGSLDLYLQHESPGAERESNWLPAPRGRLSLLMRLYAPKAAALDGTWNPPPVKRVR